MIVDAHHHFWDPAAADYPWLTDELAPIRRPFGPDDLAPLAASDRGRRDRPRPDALEPRRDAGVPRDGRRDAVHPRRRRLGRPRPIPASATSSPRSASGSGRRSPGRDPPPGPRRARSRVAAARRRATWDRGGRRRGPGLRPARPSARAAGGAAPSRAMPDVAVRHRPPGEATDPRRRAPALGRPRRRVRRPARTSAWKLSAAS